MTDRPERPPITVDAAMQAAVDAARAWEEICGAVDGTVVASDRDARAVQRAIALVVGELDNIQIEAFALTMAFNLLYSSGRINADPAYMRGRLRAAVTSEGSEG